MIAAAVKDNLLPWIEQVVLLATVGALLPALFRVRHPASRLMYGHLLLIACLVLPFVEPWRAAGPPAGIPSAVVWILAAGVAVRLVWLTAGLREIRRYRIGATPLYPIPESVRAAAELTRADAVVCVSPDTPGPVMLGSLCPVVLLPESFLGLDEEAQCGIACHEFLHVRRNDWLVTIAEEVLSAVFWFNPGVWWLVSETRLAREQVVDAETVRLTDAAGPYIDALMAIARTKPGLDLAPAPLFLRRRHLTQRMQLLLKEVSMSKLRLLTSYGSMAAILTAAGWFAAVTFPMSGRAQVTATSPASGPAPAPPVMAQVRPPRATAPVANAPAGGRVLGGVVFQMAPVPVDPHEPVTGGVQVAATPPERAAALALLDQARQNSNMHIAGSAPYRLDVTFQAGGRAAATGPGQLSETWLSGRNWQWTASLGSYSQTQTGYNGRTVAEQHVAGPVRIQMLRSLLFAPVQATSLPGIRTAAARWNGVPVTCVLLSGVMGAPASSPNRMWEETEDCVDPATGVLAVHSPAPGAYAVYSYANSIQFHGRRVPDRVTFYSGGVEVLDARIAITDAAVDARSLVPSPEAIAKGPAIVIAGVQRFPLDVPGSAGNPEIKPVIVMASIAESGEVLEAEAVMASDPGLAQAAIDAVKSRNFSGGNQRQAYINVRFLPPSQ